MGQRDVLGNKPDDATGRQIDAPLVFPRNFSEVRFEMERTDKGTGPRTNEAIDVRSFNIHVGISDEVIDAFDFGQEVEAEVFPGLPGNIYVYSRTLIDPEYSSARLQLLRLQYDDAGLVTHVTPNVSNELLRSFFTNVPDNDISNGLKRALGLSDATESDLNAYRLLTDAAKITQECDVAIKKQKQPYCLESTLYQAKLPTEQMQTVGQGQYATFSTNSSVRYLGTFGAASCVLVGILAEEDNTNFRVASEAHMDGFTDELSTLNAMFHSIKQEQSGHVINSYRFHVAGGDNSSQQQVRNIFARLKDFSESSGVRVEIVIGDLMHSGNASLCIDIQEGAFFKFVADPSAYHDLGLNMSFGKSPARRVR